MTPGWRRVRTLTRGYRRGDREIVVSWLHPQPGTSRSFRRRRRIEGATGPTAHIPHSQGGVKPKDIPLDGAVKRTFTFWRANW